MASISNVDLVMAALRSRLRRVAANRRADKASASSAHVATESPPQERIEAINAMRQLPSEEFGRSFVRAMLETELGEAISDDPRFHRLVERVHRTLQQDPELAKALQQIQRGDG